jgi:uncharacterized membrane protein
MLSVAEEIAGGSPKHSVEGKVRKMEKNSSKGQASHKSVYYAGSGLAIGAAIGMIFGLMLFENLALGCAIGAALGLIVGAAIDAYNRR